MSEALDGGYRRGAEQSELQPDMLGQYLHEIGQFELLEHEQVVELAKTIEAGLAAEHKLQETTGLDEQHLEELAWLSEEGRRAKEQMINANLRLVVSFASRHNRQSSKVEFMDMIQHGNRGLIRAVEKFDYKQGYQFSTYAAWWIRQEMYRGTEQGSRLVHLPMVVSSKLATLVRVRNDKKQELQRDPSEDELVEATGFDEATIAELLSYGAREPSSLDEKLSQDSELTLGELAVATTSEEDPAKQAIEACLEADLDSLLGRAGLDSREQEIVKARYGLSSKYGRGENVAQKRLGATFGLSVQMVSRVEKVAIGKLEKAAGDGEYADSLRLLLGSMTE